jgi:branched-chain amino acid aminotransferase
MSEQVYLNGNLIPREEAKISVSDRGLLYGYGLFETVRAYHGKLFLLDKHLQRLFNAAEAIGIKQKLAGIDLEAACEETLQANGLKEARVRLTVTSGENRAMPWVDASGLPTVIVTAVPYTPFPPEKYAQGFRVGIASLRRARNSVVGSMKSINYLLNVMARMETAASGLDEAILLDDGGNVSEGGGSNVFFVNGGAVVTPWTASGIIPGVTRQLVMEIARELGIKVIDGPVSLDDMKRCKEMFMTNALIEIMPVIFVRDESGKDFIIGDGKPGKVTQKLMTAYCEKVEKETLNSDI